MIITIQDAYFSTTTKRKFCNKGIRLFCKKYEIDYDDFRKNGIEERVLLSTNDSMALQVVEEAHGRKQ
jgi:hypothetical protein